MSQPIRLELWDGRPAFVQPDHVRYVTEDEGDPKLTKVSFGPGVGILARGSALDIAERIWPLSGQDG